MAKGNRGGKRTGGNSTLSLQDQIIDLNAKRDKFQQICQKNFRYTMKKNYDKDKAEAYKKAKAERDKIDAKIDALKNKLQSTPSIKTGGRTFVTQTTSTYNRAVKRRRSNFDAWFNGGKQSS